MKALKISRIVTVGCFVWVLVQVLPLTTALGSDFKPPDVVVLTAPGSTTAASYVTGTALFGPIGKKTDVTFNIVPRASSHAGTVYMKQGKAQFGITNGSAAYQGVSGISDYKPMGPQSLRLVWRGGDVIMGFMARGDSGIKKWPDVKGRRVATYKAYPGTHVFMEEGLAFANLTWDDVIPTEAGSFGKGGRAVIDGAVDVAITSIFGSLTYELAASPHGLSILPMPASDTAGWARLHEVMGSMYPITYTDGPGASKEGPVATMAHDREIVAYDWTDEQLVYWLTKQIAESYDDFKDKHKVLVQWTVEHALRSETWAIPWHEGSVKYFKTAGVWTAEHEAKQRKLLAKFPHRMTK